MKNANPLIFGKPENSNILFKIFVRLFILFFTINASIFLFILFIAGDSNDNILWPLLYKAIIFGFILSVIISIPVYFVNKLQNRFTNKNYKYSFITLSGIIIAFLWILIFQSLSNNMNVCYFDVVNKNECFYNYAVSHTDSSYCEHIKDNVKLYNCYGSVARKTGDIKLLNKIPDDNEKYSKNYWIQEIALRKMDPNLCERVDNENDKNVCLYNISGIKGGDPDICKNISDSTYNIRGQCYFDLAREKLDTNYCSLGNYKLPLCYSYIAIRKKNLKICDEIKNTDLKLDCYIDYAEGTLDDSVCSLMPIGRPETKCYFGIAKATKDHTECSKVSTEKDRDWCYVWYVDNNKNDIHICNLIKNDQVKSNCYKYR